LICDNTNLQNEETESHLAFTKPAGMCQWICNQAQKQPNSWSLHF